jgi:glycosyltransferase involved in cell wall biosynthesis
MAFTSTYDTSDLGAWSGTIFHMLAALSESGFEVDVVDKLIDPYSLVFKAKRLIKNIVLKKNYLRDREPLTLKCYARQVEGRLSTMKPDIVFSPGTKPIAYLRTSKPIIFWTDATFDGMINFYPEFTNLCDETIRNGRRMEQAALSNSRLAIYSSEWAAQTAIRYYNVDSRKIKVVPFGANLARSPSADEVREAIASRGSGVCKLLFVGIDWYRKGGDKALAVASILNQQKLDAELHVVGCEPPQPLPAFVKTHGFLSKSNREQNERILRLYETSDFLVLPSKAESFGIVIAEANAFGLPALTTDVGGMRTAVRDGKNGWAFDRRCFVEQCAEYILQTISSTERYHQLCASSFREYSERLNWRSAVQSVRNLIASEGPL